ncbi:hypothetical protein [Xanthomonas vesicatoria]|uniref:hypothetical protein n=1 Tax=Xanthomonas vesicatoria TaxID=56460 RepID=UPI00073210F6|nr:hypothetical protein [Xanthomonas vesicatoria]KTF36795.1 hypothetical protein LMG919_09810 [Xanthomonas vesicatoria]MCC8560057.1 hypothetical protein [Xanthomonas vesicatoria]MCC8603239.1 hypothetical protein [Xanthomonas vesicatoria]MCC8611686.1 hypothetical protein [Xanthomonas vesicatoria]MCC8619177.1 hypothetical protein [Xanthomonas vesicatoria]
MKGRLAWCGLVAVGLCGCATQHVLEQDRSQREDSVDQRMLPPQSGGGSGGAVSAYTLAQTQRFRMPRALHNEAPVLPADSPRQTLPPTTVCAHVILAADGAVQRVDPMSDRDECAAGLLPENTDLLQAVRTTVQHWQFVPAALCTYAPGVAQPAALDDCSGATHAEPVPVTLSFAFTFEVRQGKVSVRTGKVAQ